jgi:hypothetical protein
MNKEAKVTKYQVLTDWFQSQDGSMVDLNFRQIESILSFPLPKSARTYREWWANSQSGHVQSRGWLDANWQVDTADLASQRIRFVKLRAQSRLETKSRNPSLPDQKGEPLAPIASTKTQQNETNILQKLELSQRARDWLSTRMGNETEFLDQFQTWIEKQAAIAARQSIIDKYASLDNALGSDSVELIREDRDAR